MASRRTGLTPELHKRADQGRLSIPCELGLLVDRCRCVLEVTRKNATLLPGRFCRSYLECGAAELAQLLLGSFDVEEAAATGRIRASTRVALETARVLLPRVPLWYPPLDDLRA